MKTMEILKNNEALLDRTSQATQAVAYQQRGKVSHLPESPVTEKSQGIPIVPGDRFRGCVLAVGK